MNRQRILFVDDDPSVLGGLRNFFRKDRHRWDLVFAASGESALAEFAAGHFDVIVCDMRMPGMDGATLLQHVKDDYPETTRIVLSGQADEKGIARALPVTHQFLSKPCDGEVLRAVLERTCGLRALLVNDGIKKIIGGVNRLPSHPGLYWELVSVISRGDATADEIAGIVECDPAMTAKILQLVNSAYFGLAQRVTSIAQAITYLGSDLVKGLTLGMQVFKAFDGVTTPGFSLTQLQQHSLMTARLARRLAPSARLRDESFTAAMVHDIGEVVLAIGCKERLAELMLARETQQAPLHVVERQLFGVTHAEVGAYLLGIWGLPFTMIEAVAFHHEPGMTVGDPELLALVHVADALVPRGDDTSSPVRPDLAFLEAAGLASRLPQWREIAFEHLDNMPRKAQP